MAAPVAAAAARTASGAATKSAATKSAAATATTGEVASTAAAGGRRVASGASTVAGLRGPGIVNQGSGFVLGLVVYALVLNYLRGGPARVKGWLRAKFINQPYGAAKQAGHVERRPTTGTGGPG